MVLQQWRNIKVNDTIEEVLQQGRKVLEQKNNRYYRSVVREINGAAQSFVDPYVLVLGYRVMRRSAKQNRNDTTRCEVKRCEAPGKSS